MINKSKIMSVEIVTVKSRKQFRIFAEFANNLYKGHPYYVPSMPSDDLATFDKDKNAAYEFSEAEFYLAYKDGKVAGRIAAIINYKANKSWNKDQVRFGWIDFIDDIEVTKALLEAVVAFGKERGMKEIVGPLGFTDFDPEGMLIEGFDEMGSMPMIYNHPYYMHHLEQLGYVKETDWVEYLVTVPEVIPERHFRIAEVIRERNNLHVRKITRRELRKEKYGHKFFNLINETYAHLYGYSLLSEKQIEQYVDLYMSFLDLRMVSFVENQNGELIGAGITMPSLSKALQKCNGKLFPFGWWYLLKTIFIKKPETMDMLLVGVKPEYRNKGVTTLLIIDVFQSCKKFGIKYAETCGELETNTAVQSMWKEFEHRLHKRRRLFVKSI